MSDDDEDASDYLRDQYETNLIEDAIRDQSIEQAGWYLGTYGDAVDERVQRALTDARALADLGYFGPALTLSGTATELIVRYLLLRPLAQGAFLSDEVAEILTKRAIGGRSAEDRELLPAVARASGIDLVGTVLADGTPLWEFVKTVMWPKRHSFVHAGELVEEATARNAIETVDLMLSDFVAPLAERFELTWPATPWRRVELATTRSGYRMSRTYTPRSPFAPNH